MRTREQITRDRYRILQAIENRPTWEGMRTSIIAWEIQRPRDVVYRDLIALEREGFTHRDDMGRWK